MKPRKSRKGKAKSKNDVPIPAPGRNLSPQYPHQPQPSTTTPFPQLETFPETPIRASRTRKASQRATDPNNAATAVDILFSPTPLERRRRQQGLPNENLTPLTQSIFVQPGPSRNTHQSVCRQPIAGSSRQPIAGSSRHVTFQFSPNEPMANISPSPLPTHRSCSPLESISSPLHSPSSSSADGSSSSQNDPECLIPAGPNRARSTGPAGNKN
jgi:hypothetical protein